MVFSFWFQVQFQFILFFFVVVTILVKSYGADDQGRSEEKILGCCHADQGRSWFCRKQSSEADIPILPINVKGGHSHLSDALSILCRREESISPFKIVVGEHSIHATPLPNPLSSHHILQLYSPSLQDFKVDALIEDATLYFTAFRRRVRRRTPRTRNRPLGPGPWRVFKDQVNYLPSFFRENAEKIEMDSGYEGYIVYLIATISSQQLKNRFLLT